MTSKLLPPASAFVLHETVEPVCITVGVYNFRDGVGDFQLLLKWGRHLKPLLAGQGFTLVGYLVLKETETRKYQPWILDHIARFLQTHPFDLVYISCNNTRILQDYSLPDTVVFDEAASIGALKKTRVYIDIEHGASPRDFSQYLLPHCRIIQNGECGIDQQIPKFPNGIVFNSGLPSGEVDEARVFGLMLEPLPHLEKENAARALLTLTPSVLQCLLAGENPTIETALAYLDTHRLMLGYPQNTVTSLVYILVQMQFKTEMTADFLLPAKSLSVEVIVFFFKNQFPKFNLQILDMQTDKILVELHQSDKNRLVRIFSSHFLSENDRSVLYSISRGPGICSGDNSFAETISAGVLPFIAPAKAMNQFSMQFIAGQLTPFLMRHQYIALACYFAVTKEKLDNLLENRSINIDAVMTCVSNISQSISSELFDEWQKCKQLLVEQYSLPNYIQGVLSAALNEVLSNENLLSAALNPKVERGTSFFSSPPRKPDAGEAKHSDRSPLFPKN